MNKNNVQTEIDLLVICKILLENIKWLLISAVIGAVILIAYTYLHTGIYYSSSASVYVSGSNRKVIVGASQFDVVLEDAIERSGADLSAEQLSSELSVEAINDNDNLFTFTVTDKNRNWAIVLANAVAEAATEQFPVVVPGSSAQIVDSANSATTSFLSTLKKRIVIGVFLGIVASAAIIVIRYLILNYIESQNDLKKWSYPVLAVIPDVQTKKEI